MLGCNLQSPLQLPTVAVTATVMATVRVAAAAIAMGARMYTFTKNGWGRSHLAPPKGALPT